MEDTCCIWTLQHFPPIIPLWVLVSAQELLIDYDILLAHLINCHPYVPSFHAEPGTTRSTWACSTPTCWNISEQTKEKTSAYCSTLQNTSAFQTTPSSSSKENKFSSRLSPTCFGARNCAKPIVSGSAQEILTSTT